MPARSRPRSSAAAPPACALDLVALTPVARGLSVLLVETPGRRGRWQLPSGAWRDSGDIAAALTRLGAFVLGAPPTWQEQVGAFSEGTHPSGAALTVAAVTVVARGTEAGGATAWHAVNKLPANLPSRQRAIIAAAVTHVRRCLDQTPVAFHLLPARFTLTDLQEVYEILLGRVLHKASFRRVLQAAGLVKPADEWRSEGRGRPAQLFTFDDRRRRRSPRAIRFEFE